nr:Glycerophosphodiester phosphodiesterase [Ipomoea batatas]
MLSHHFHTSNHRERVAAIVSFSARVAAAHKSCTICPNPGRYWVFAFQVEVHNPFSAASTAMNCCENPVGRVVCPMPRRPNAHSTRTLVFPMSNSSEGIDSKTDASLVDLALKKDSVVAMQSISQLSSSPPFFSGSPPCRTNNPLIHDTCFRNEKPVSIPLPQSPPLSGISSRSPSSACTRARLGQQQSPVRVEGFDCQNSRLAGIA